MAKDPKRRPDAFTAGIDDIRKDLERLRISPAPPPRPSQEIRAAEEAQLAKVVFERLGKDPARVQAFIVALQRLIKA